MVRIMNTGVAALVSLIGFSIYAPAVQAQTAGTTKVEFRLASPDLKKISGGRIIVIDDTGKVVSTGLTDSQGTWQATVPVEEDPRFKSVRTMGTVTALALAQGYNEEAVFEVPVFAGSVQPIMMIPLSTGRRNEPGYTLGNLHRQDVIRMIDAYAKELDLTKQPPIPGEQGYAPWGSDVKGR